MLGLTSPELAAPFQGHMYLQSWERKDFLLKRLCVWGKGSLPPHFQSPPSTGTTPWANIPSHWPELGKPLSRAAVDQLLSRDKEFATTNLDQSWFVPWSWGEDLLSGSLRYLYSVTEQTGIMLLGKRDRDGCQGACWPSTGVSSHPHLPERIEES